MSDIEASQARRHFANALVPGVDQDFALGELTKAIELDPTFAEAYVKRALIDLFGAPTRGPRKLPDWSKDMADAQKAMQLNPNLVEAYFVRGWIFLAPDICPAEIRKRGIDDLKKVLELSPSFSVTLTHLDVLTGKMAVIGPNEIRKIISMNEIRIQKRTMKDLVDAIISAKSVDERWKIVSILTTGANEGPEKFREIKRDEEGINMLIEALGSNDSEICRAAAYVLWFWPDERAFKPLLKCVSVYGDRWPLEFKFLDDALDNVEKKIGNPSAVDELYNQALTDQDPAIREAAAKRFQTLIQHRLGLGQNSQL